MDNRLKKMINEAFDKAVNKRKKYEKTRSLVEGMVREALQKKINEENNDAKKASQVQDALNDPAINKSGLARKIDSLSGNDDTRRSEISKIARGEWIPDINTQNQILHQIASDTE